MNRIPLDTGEKSHQERHRKTGDTILTRIKKQRRRLKEKSGFPHAVGRMGKSQQNALDVHGARQQKEAVMAMHYQDSYYL
jgi:hypothetical protein